MRLLILTKDSLVNVGVEAFFFQYFFGICPGSWRLKQKKLAIILPVCLVVNGLRLRAATKLFITLFCVLQVCVLSLAVVSADLHRLVFHNQHVDSDLFRASCTDHSNGTSPEKDQTPDNGKHCPVTIFAQGLTVAEALISDNWKYVDYLSFQFSEPKSLYSVVCTNFIRQRAPPLS